MGRYDLSTGKGTGAGVCGILSIIFCWVPFAGIVLGILGIVLCNLQRKIMPTGMATAGLVTGIIGLVFNVGYTIFWLCVLAIAGAAATAVNSLY